MYGNSFKALEGHKILALHGSAEILQFTTEFEILSYASEGDCCPSSWFSHISGVEFLVGHTVVKAEDITLNSIKPEEEKEYECLQQYGYRLTTDKGYFEIDMRNSSNGYYGGYISGPLVFKGTTCPKIETDW